MYPFFTLNIEQDNEGMDFMGLVENPAHMKAWITLSGSKEIPKKYVFKQYFDEEKRIVHGVAIAADLPIYRHDDEIGDHYVVFKAEEIQKIAIKLAEDGYLNNVNEHHDMNKTVKGMVFFGSYFIDKEAGVYPKCFEDQNLQKGTWCVMYKVNNDTTWEKMKSGEYLGFSIEGWFTKNPLKMKMNSTEKVVFARLSQVNTWDIEVLEEAIDFGTVIHYAYRDQEGEVFDGGHLQAGEYITPDRKKIQVDSTGAVVMIDGKVQMKKTNVKKTVMNKKPLKKKGLFDKLFKTKLEEYKTEAGLTIKIDGELVEGGELKAVQEDGTEILAPEGEHVVKFDDGTMKTITVDGKGIITSVVDTEEEMADDTEMAKILQKVVKDQAAGFKRIEDANKKAIDELRKEFTKKMTETKAEHEKQFKTLCDAMDEAAEEDGTAGKKKFNKSGGKSKGEKQTYRELLNRGKNRDNNSDK